LDWGKVLSKPNEISRWRTAPTKTIVRAVYRIQAISRRKGNIGVIGIEFTPFRFGQKDNILKCVMLLLPAKVMSFCQEEKRKLQV